MGYMGGLTYIAIPTCKGAAKSNIRVDVTQVPARLLGRQVLLLNYGGLVTATLRTGHLGREMRKKNVVLMSYFPVQPTVGFISETNLPFFFFLVFPNLRVISSSVYVFVQKPADLKVMPFQTNIIYAKHLPTYFARITKRCPENISVVSMCQVVFTKICHYYYCQYCYCHYN